MNKRETMYLGVAKTTPDNNQYRLSKGDKEKSTSKKHENLLFGIKGQPVPPR